MKRLVPTLLALLLVAACGSSSGSSHDDADVAFAQQMVPHHQQAVQMARLAPDAGGSPEVAALAEQILQAQGPEIGRMQTWLAEWDEGGSADHSGHSGGMSMDGMASTADVDRLATLKGAAFDRLFLTLMIAHHEGAVDMARTELNDGKDPRATKLARSIVQTQQREIATMKGLLG